MRNNDNSYNEKSHHSCLHLAKGLILKMRVIKSEEEQNKVLAFVLLTLLGSVLASLSCEILLGLAPLRLGVAVTVLALAAVEI